jgi:hypothetical protein
MGLSATRFGTRKKKERKTINEAANKIKKYNRKKYTFKNKIN